MGGFSFLLSFLSRGLYRHEEYRDNDVWYTPEDTDGILPIVDIESNIFFNKALHFDKCDRVQTIDHGVLVYLNSSGAAGYHDVFLKRLRVFLAALKNGDSNVEGQLAIPLGGAPKPVIQAGADLTINLDSLKVKA